MPSFADPADDEARAIVARLFPRHAVVQVPTSELAKADGNIHCIAQQQPAAQPPCPPRERFVLARR
jgi:agmatine deiminase